MTIIRKNRVFWLIVLAGVIIRTCLVYFSYDLNTDTDAWKYDHIAQNIAFKGIYSIQRLETPNAEPTALYPLVYPALLASVYYMFGYNPHLINYLHIALYVIACIVIFKLASIIFNETAGVWAILFFSFEPVVLLYSIIAMPEILIAVFLPLSIYLLIKFLQPDTRNRIRYKYLILSNIILGIAMLTKPVIFYFPLLSILFAFIYGRKSIRRAIIASLVTIIVVGLVISPWIIRNYKIWHKFCFVEVKGFVSPEKESLLKKIDYVKWIYRKYPGSIKNPAIRYILGTATITFYRTFVRTDNLHKYYMSDKIKPEGKNMDLELSVNLSGPNANDYIRLWRYSWKFAVLELLFLSTLLIIYVLASTGIFFALKYKKIKELLVLVFVILYFATIILLDSTSNSRYRFASAPFYAILAGYGLSRLLAFRNKTAKIEAR